ncbi:hypothetical protein SprV_0301263700 [Sparganum proliferum]
MADIGVVNCPSPSAPEALSQDVLHVRRDNLRTGEGHTNGFADFGIHRRGGPAMVRAAGLPTPQTEVLGPRSFFPLPPMQCRASPPSEGEVVDAMQKLRNNKAPGGDSIPTESFKSCVDTLAPWLHEVIERAWRDEVVPDDWGLGSPVPILKKGDKTRCENYRDISLFDVAAKIFAIVLLSRFRAARDSVPRRQTILPFPTCSPYLNSLLV